MARLLDDLKYGIRIHAKNPGFTSIALLTVALSVGAATAVFSVVNAIMLKPLPYPHAEQIVLPWRLAPQDVNVGYEEIPWGAVSFQRMAADARAYQSLAAFKPESFNLKGAGEPVLVDGVRASAGFFEAVGVHPRIGRAFTAQEDVPKRERQVVLSDELWKREFHGNEQIVGRTIELNAQLYTVLGVMPPGFEFPRGEEMPGSFGFPRRTQLWTPLALPAISNDPDELAIIGRLKPGVTSTQAQAEMNVLKGRMEEDLPGAKGWFNSRVTPLTKQVSGDTRTPLLLMLVAVAVLLLIGCSNIANLLLARSLGRSAELSLRVALGANRSRLVFQLLTESLLLAIGGGLLGLLSASAAIEVLKLVGPANVPRLQEAALNPRVFAFAIGTALISGILFGLAPAFACSGNDLAESLRAGGRSAGSATKVARVRNTLLVAEVALALVLVIASGLLAQTFFRLLKTDPGFQAAHVLTFELSLPASTYKDDEQMVRFYQRALQALRATPGVESAGLTEMAPMNGATDGTGVRVPGRIAPRDENPVVNYTIGSSGYFAAIGTAVLRGRPFLDSDTSRSPQVVIVNQSMAKKLWPGKDPLGQQVAVANGDYPLMTIVGIVQNVKHLSLREEPGPEMYVPFTQKPFPSMRMMQFVVRSSADPKPLASSAQAAIRSLDSGLPVGKVTTLQAIVDASVAGQRFSMILLGSFAVLSLLLASSGLYGVISYWVTQRTREIGVRMVLGATRGTVLGMVVRQGLRVALAGIVIGLASAIGLTRFMASFLYGVRATDAPTFAIVALILLLVATFACYVPALRAARVDPNIALRYE